MSVWREWRDEFLDETLRRQGLGEAFHRPQCATCGIRLKRPTPEAADETGTLFAETTTPEPPNETADFPSDSQLDERPAVDTVYRCRVCGEWKECVDCCRERHLRTPLHRIEVLCFSAVGYRDW